MRLGHLGGCGVLYHVAPLGINREKVDAVVELGTRSDKATDTRMV